MSSFKGKFSRIQEGFSSNRRIPRLGKIRLGIKKVAKSGKEYPSETDYFVCPEEVQRIYGDQPRELDVMLMSEDPEIVAPQKLARYGLSKGLTCHGDGVNAERFNEATKEWESRSCPCEYRKTNENPKGDCTETTHLMVLLPKVNLGGCYQVTTRSYNSTVDINSGLEYIKALIGRISMVPLKLRRQATQTHHDSKKQTHYTLSLTLDADIEGINKLREDTTRVLSSARFQIEGPVEENPASDPPDVIDAESTEVEEEDEQPARDIKKQDPPATKAQSKLEETEAPDVKQLTLDAQAPLKTEPPPKEEPSYQVGKLSSVTRRQTKTKAWYYSIHIISNTVELEYVTKEEPQAFGLDFYDDLCNEHVRFAWKHVDQGRKRELYYLEKDPATVQT